MRLEPLENVEVLNALPEVTSTEYVRASLVDKNGDIIYRFLYNPQELKLNKSVEYSEVPIGGTAIQPHYYNHTKGSTLLLENLLFDTYCDGRSSRELIEGLGRLTLPETDTRKPKVISFVFGSFSFGPAIITNLDWTISSFIGGEPVYGSINLTLKETTGEQLPSNFGRINQSGSNENSGNLSLPTSRESEQIQVQVNQYLASNLSNLPAELQDAFRSRLVTSTIVSYDRIDLLINNRLWRERAFTYNRQSGSVSYVNP